MSRDISLGNLGTGRDISLSPPTGLINQKTASGFSVIVWKQERTSGTSTPTVRQKTASGSIIISS